MASGRRVQVNLSLTSYSLTDVVETPINWPGRASHTVQLPEGVYLVYNPVAISNNYISYSTLGQAYMDNAASFYPSYVYVAVVNATQTIYRYIILSGPTGAVLSRYIT